MSSLEKFNITLKDGIFLAVYIVSATLFFSSQAAKIDQLTTSVHELKENQKEYTQENKVIYQNLQNQVNTNSLQIKLIQQEMGFMADRTIIAEDNKANKLAELK